MANLIRRENRDVVRPLPGIADGVLTVQIPKRPEVQPKRISIGNGNSGTEGKARA